MSRRGWGLGLVVVLGLLAVGLLAGQPRRSGPPLDPRSTDPDGTRALVLVLDQLGATVDLDRRVPAAGDQVTLVLHDDLSSAERTELLDWVTAGGTLVVADPTSSLHPGRLDGPPVDGPLAPGACTVDVLDGIGPIDPGAPTRLFAAPAGVPACYARDGRAFAVVTPLGSGTVVALAGPEVFTNAQLDQADNAVLAGVLLAPQDGTRVLLAERARPGAAGGDESLAELVPDRVWAGLAQLLVAFVVLVAALGRRLGRPVTEAQPVELPGSGLVEGVGHLMERAGHRDDAATALRAGVRAEVAGALGLGPEVSSEQLAHGLVSLGAVSGEEARRALGEGPVGDDRELLAVARAVVAVRAGLRPKAPAVASVATGEGGPAGAGDLVVQDVEDDVEVVGG